MNTHYWCRKLLQCNFRWRFVTQICELMCKYSTVRLQSKGVLRKMFWRKRGELIGEWRRYVTRSFMMCTPHQILIKSRRMKLAGHVVRTGDRKRAYRVLVWRPEGKRPLGRPRRRWEDNIIMGLKKWDGGMNWICLAQNRDRWRALVNAVMNLRVP